ncbi:MAG: methyltransferase [Micrococcales bacterium]|nr:methyltransferase [Micrococcales bacterium]
MSLPAPTPVPELLPLLRADLSAAGFTVDGLVAHLGPMVSSALGREQLLPAERATRTDGSPAAALVRLFTLGVEVPFDVVDAALPQLGADGLGSLGLAERTGAGVRATCDLRPYGDEGHVWWVASDLSTTTRSKPLPPDHVLGIGGASVTLASWTPRPLVRRALDLGVGAGVQALHLAGHAEQVVATDLSARALDYARFNSALAQQEWDLRLGDMFDPVTGERFDLVVSNPPYVITPRRARVPVYEYRDAGRAGDVVVEDLVRGVGDILEPGGIAHFIGNWEIHAETTWRDRWRGWLQGTGLDAFVVQRGTQDPAEYAETWARDGGHLPGSWVHDELYAAWLEDFAERHVDGIGFGVVTLQRPRAPREPFVDLIEVRGPVHAPTGPAVLAGMASRAWLAEHDDDDVLDVAWRCAPDVTIESHSLPGDVDPQVILARQGGGLGLTQQLDTVGAALVSVCDGQLTARVALNAIGALLGGEDPTSGAMPMLRDLIARGFLRRRS